MITWEKYDEKEKMCIGEVGTFEYLLQLCDKGEWYFAYGFPDPSVWEFFNGDVIAVDDDVCVTIFGDNIEQAKTKASEYIQKKIETLEEELRKFKTSGR